MGRLFLCGKSFGFGTSGALWEEADNQSLEKLKLLVRNRPCKLHTLPSCKKMNRQRPENPQSLRKRLLFLQKHIFLQISLFIEDQEII